MRYASRNSLMRLFFHFVCFFVLFFCLVFFFFSCVSFSRKVSIRQNVKTTIVQNLPEREKEREMSEFDSGDRQQQQRRKTAQLHADSLIPGCQTRSHQAQLEPCEAQTQACTLEITLNMIEAPREMTWYRCADGLHHPLCSIKKTFDCLPEEFSREVCGFKREITSFSTSFYAQNVGCSDTDTLMIIIADYYVSLWPIIMDKMAEIKIIKIIIKLLIIVIIFFK